MKRIFSCPILICYTVFSPAILLVSPVILCCLSDTKYLVKNLIIILFLYLMLSFIMFLSYRWAFTLVILRNENVKTRHITLGWNDINFVTTITIELFKYRWPKLFSIDLICISKNEESWSFFKRNKKCILIAKNSRNLKLLAEYSNGMSIAINEYLSEHESY